MVCVEPQTLRRLGPNYRDKNLIGELRILSDVAFMTIA